MLGRRHSLLSIALFGRHGVRSGVLVCRRKGRRNVLWRYICSCCNGEIHRERSASRLSQSAASSRFLHFCQDERHFFLNLIPDAILPRSLKLQSLGRMSLNVSCTSGDGVSIHTISVRCFLLSNIRPFTEGLGYALSIESSYLINFFTPPLPSPIGPT